MQDMTPEVCAKAPIGSISSLADKRDQKVYDIIKATDGNCWMRENLALDLSPTITLTPEDTDVKQPWTPSHATQSPDQKGQAYLWKTGSEDRSYRRENPTDGNLYSWRAAVAGNIPDLKDSPAGMSFNHSICPHGWTLPGNYSLNAKTLFWKILNIEESYSSDFDITNDIPDVNLIKSGEYSTNSQNYGKEGFYWTSLRHKYPTYNGLTIKIKDNNTITARSNNSASIRCVVRGAVDTSSLADITYMQEMNYDICTNTSEYFTKVLIDRRDGKSYQVVKAKDNNCWMADNLALILNTSKPLTPEDSDVSVSWTPNLNTQSQAESGKDYLWRNYNLPDYERRYYSEARSYDTGYPSHGVMYNYYSATAGSGNYEFTHPLPKYENALDSVCPKGWQLPVSHAFRSLETILKIYGNDKDILKNSPLKILQSGYYSGYNGLYDFDNKYGYTTGYWLATSAHSNFRHKNIGIVSRFKNAVFQIYNADPYNGFAIRCVAR